MQENDGLRAFSNRQVFPIQSIHCEGAGWIIDEEGLQGDDFVYRRFGVNILIGICGLIRYFTSIFTVAVIFHMKRASAWSRVSVTL